MSHLEDKMLHRSDSVEQSLTFAIRRAAERKDEAELTKLATAVEGLANGLKNQRSGNCGKLLRCVRNLHAELRAAVTGHRVAAGIWETKDCAVSLRQRSSFPAVKRISGAMAISGYGSAFGGEPDAYGDIIAPGAFRRTLAAHRQAGSLPKMFFSHDPAQIAGAWTDMHEDSYGLAVEGALAPTTLGKDLNTLVEMGALDALSIGFRIPAGGSYFDKNHNRVITEIDLGEVSLVALPANSRALLRGHSASTHHSSIGLAIADLRRLVEQDEAEDSARRAGKLIDFPVAHDDEAEIVIAAQRLVQRLSS